MVAPDGGEEKGLNVRCVLAFVRGTGGSCLLLTVTVPKSSDRANQAMETSRFYWCWCQHRGCHHITAETKGNVP